MKKNRKKIKSSRSIFDNTGSKNRRTKKIKMQDSRSVFDNIRSKHNTTKLLRLIIILLK